MKYNKYNYFSNIKNKEKNITPIYKFRREKRKKTMLSVLYLVALLG